MAAVKELLLETLNDLSDEEFLKFKSLLPSMTFLTSGSDCFSLTQKTRETVDKMVMEFGQQSVEFTLKVLTYLNRTDLVQRSLESSSAPSSKTRKI